MMRLKKDPAIAAAQFSASIREASRLTGYSERDVTRQMVGSALKIAAGRTQVAPPAKSDPRSRLALTHFIGASAPNGEQSVSINAGARIRKLGPGFVWFCGHNKAGKRTFKLAGKIDDSGNDIWGGLHFSAGQWSQIRQIASQYIMGIRGHIAGGRAAAGLGRQSWLQIADALGIPLETVPGRGLDSAGIAKAKAAMASNGKRYINGTGSEANSGNGKYIATLRNELPYALKIKFDSMMTTVLAGEANRFNKMHEKGVFDSQAKLARAYPWVKVLGAAPEVPPA